jgi:hypothetical protein
MKIKKIEENRVYHKIVDNIVFEVNGKKVRVCSWSIDDPEMGNYEGDVEIDEQDLKILTDVESEALGEYMSENLDLKVGEEWDTEAPPAKKLKTEALKCVLRPIKN